MAKSRKIWIVIVLAVVVYLLMSIYADFDELSLAFAKFNVAFIFVLFALTTVNYLLRFLKWDFFLRRAGIRMKLLDNLFVFFSGLSMIVTPGKIGEIWKGWLIRDINGEKLSKTIPVVVVERITDVLGLIILSLFGVAYFTHQAIYIILAFLVVFIGFYAVIRSGIVSRKIIGFFEKRESKHIENIKVAHDTFQIIMEAKGIIIMSLLSAFAWLFECLGMYFIVIAFQESINFTLATFIFSLASLAGALSMIPGGLGVAEATIAGLLQLFQFTPSLSVGIAIIVRLGTLWYGAAMGLAVYLLFPKKKLSRLNDGEKQYQEGLTITK